MSKHLTVSGCQKMAMMMITRRERHLWVDNRRGWRGRCISRGTVANCSIPDRQLGRNAAAVLFTEAETPACGQGFVVLLLRRESSTMAMTRTSPFQNELEPIDWCMFFSYSLTTRGQACCAVLSYKHHALVSIIISKH